MTLPWKKYIKEEVTQLYFIISKRRPWIGPFHERRKVSSFYEKDRQLNRFKSTENISSYPEKRKYSDWQNEESKISTHVDSFYESRERRSQLNLINLKVVKEKEDRGKEYREEERVYLLNKFIEHLKEDHGKNI